MRKTNVLTLARKELSAYFYSPMAYVIGGLFLLAVGVVFLWGVPIPLHPIRPVFHVGAESTLRPLFDLLAYALAAVVPLLTMRLLAEEFRSGTIEALMTAPVTDTEVICGKFLGAYAMYLILLAATLAYFLLIVIFGSPDYGVALMGYVGMVLLGALYVAVGVFASTLTRHQLVAGLIGITILLALTLGMYRLGASFPEHASTIGRLNAISHFRDFSKGVFDTRGLVYFATLTAFFLFVSVKGLESRRWR